MAEFEHGAICESGELVNGGRGVRFAVRRGGSVLPAFAVRYGDRVYAYLNQCSHRGVELDWNPGEFFDAEGRYLVCATHGAQYDPDSGRCAGGPCGRVPLTALEIREQDGVVCLAGNNGIHLAERA